MTETLMLYLFAGTAVAGAALMLVLRHPMRVALALVACMLSLAGVYALLNVHVIAVFQVLIYVGAVMVFMVYAIMLLDVRDSSYTRRYSNLLLPGIAGGIALIAVLAHGFWHHLRAPVGAAAGGLFGVKQFSIAFLADYWLHFELVSVLLVAAVVAALAVLAVGRRNHG
ncbi:MAG TPA: NADH-quinone oxidoreductase subunit J [Casimicrobiaceae bacterium]|nr:NADH-quinone oxidoreductase subunit J [Casimicrobiaceae bacterium]